jgi:Cys-rich repeat protein
VLASGCYRPSLAVGVPCAANGECPAGQLCDRGRNPPTCVTTLGDAGADTPQVDARGFMDAPPDAPTTLVPITFVQTNTIKPQGTTTTLHLTKLVGAGNTIIVCMNYLQSSGASLVSLTDSLNNTYVRIVDGLVGGPTDHYLLVAANSPAGDDTLTATFSAAVAVGGSDMLVLEYSGLALDPFDVTSSMSGASMNLDSGTATTHAAHELLLGYAEGAGTSPGSGFTTRSMLAGNIVEEQIVSTIGTYAATATSSSASTSWTMILATFKGR